MLSSNCGVLTVYKDGDNVVDIMVTSDNIDLSVFNNAQSIDVDIDVDSGITFTVSYTTPYSFDIMIVGMRYCDYKNSFRKMKFDDSMIKNVEFRFEPENEFDNKAIGVYIDGKRYGYIAKNTRPDLFDSFDSIDIDEGKLCIQLNKITTHRVNTDYKHNTVYANIQVYC